MSATVEFVPQQQIVIKLDPIVKLTDDQFFEFCQINSEQRFERSASGELIVLSPTGAESGNRNASLIVQIGVWAERDGTGLIFDSSTGFTLPNGAVRSPDVAWIARSRWNTIPLAQRKKFAPICPEFVVELRSETDDLSTLQAKMQEYLDNGARLGWLIDAIEKQVYIYQPNALVQQLNNPAILSGDPTLSGFVLDLSKIW
ncbi:Uma2 family endonuclease [Microcoleus sp. FACHB-1515]|uniref:Uma2 family endonuclease n=1 Tax=Cyanophyceae TaxID=3028117 RepID=UPI0016861FD8|nr:Uma2 family endonuclease [Microcoleus sp. FACHB-1515]MBD2090058.1 Uma2 family endonuclease [Microcoleus sp. FACHB-1515]